MASCISLYAVDVVIFCHPDADDLTAVHEILHIFGAVSGLQTNFAKCTITSYRGEQCVHVPYAPLPYHLRGSATFDLEDPLFCA